MSEVRRSQHTAAGWIGLAYVLAGVVLLLDQFDVVTVSWAMLLPGLIIVLGLGLLFGALRPQPATGGDTP
jgi:hypothetical protein